MFTLIYVGEKTKPKVCKAREKWKKKRHGVMVWRMLSAAGLTQIYDRVNANIFEKLHAVTSLCSSPNHTVIFMYDIKPCHTAKQQSKSNKIMKWPAQSPDINLLKTLGKSLITKLL